MQKYLTTIKDFLIYQFKEIFMCGLLYKHYKEDKINYDLTMFGNDYLY